MGAVDKIFDFAARARVEIDDWLFSTSLLVMFADGQRIDFSSARAGILCADDGDRATLQNQA